GPRPRRPACGRARRPPPRPPGGGAPSSAPGRSRARAGRSRPSPRPATRDVPSRAWWRGRGPDRSGAGPLPQQGGDGLAVGLAPRGLHDLADEEAGELAAGLVVAADEALPLGRVGR